MSKRMLSQALSTLSQQQPTLARWIRAAAHLSPTVNSQGVLSQLSGDWATGHNAAPVQRVIPPSINFVSSYSTANTPANSQPEANRGWIGFPDGRPLSRAPAEAPEKAIEVRECTEC